MILAVIGLTMMGVGVWHGSLAFAFFGVVFVALGATLDLTRLP